MKKINEIRGIVEDVAQRASDICETNAVKDPEKITMIADLLENLADATRDLTVIVGNLIKLASEK